MRTPTILLSATLLILLNTLAPTASALPMPLPLHASPRSFSSSASNPTIISYRDPQPQPPPALQLQTAGQRGEEKESGNGESSYLTDMAIERCGEKECDWSPVGFVNRYLSKMIEVDR